MSLSHGGLPSPDKDHAKKNSPDSAIDFAVMSIEDDSPDQPSPVLDISAQPMSADHVSGSQLSLKRGVCPHCSAAFMLVSSLELHLASVHGEKLHMVLPGSSTHDDRCHAHIEVKDKVDCGTNSQMTKKKKVDEDEDEDDANDEDDGASHGDGKKRRVQQVCDVCGKSSCYCSCLNGFELIHSYTRPFNKCNTCHKTFPMVGDRSSHKRPHSKDRLYQCPPCVTISQLKPWRALQSHKKRVHDRCRPHVHGAALLNSSELAIQQSIPMGENPYVCSDCGKAFAHSTSLTQHRLTHAGEKHSRSSCGERSDLASSLAQHLIKSKQEPSQSMEDDSPDQPPAAYSRVQPVSDNTPGSLLSLKGGHVCQHCSAAFVLVSSFELHLVSVHREMLQVPCPSNKPNGCDARNCRDKEAIIELDGCGEVKTTEKKVGDRYSDFERGKKTGRRHACDACGKSFPNQSRLKRHTVIHSRVKPFVCDVCNKRFSLFSGLVTHQKKIHSEHRPCKSFVCDVCSKCFSQSCHLASHKRIHSSGSTHEGAKPHVCEVCAKSFVSSSSLKSHSLVHSGVKSFLCDTCGKSFFQYTSLVVHKNMFHVSHKPFSCDVCGKSFTEKCYMTRHKRYHIGERPYKCSRCDCAFPESGTLQRHIKTVHEGAKPHVCDVCGTAFSSIGSLNKHRRRHTGERPFVCPDCGKSFIQSAHLAQHRLTHSDERPHVCDVCGKRFARLRSLSEHHRTHTGQFPYVCSDCGKGYSRSNHLAEHRVKHTGVKPLSCPHCPVAFTRAYMLKKHISTKHQ